MSELDHSIKAADDARTAMEGSLLRGYTATKSGSLGICSAPSSGAFSPAESSGVFDARGITKDLFPAKFAIDTFCFTQALMKACARAKMGSLPRLVWLGLVKRAAFGALNVHSHYPLPFRLSRG